jgi:circadian clock protein KaiC
MPDQPLPASPVRIPTGVTGLDEILGGGLAPNRLYLVEGAPGTGKTTLALAFLMAGAALGEGGLYVTLSETGEELEAVAASHGWSPLPEGLGLLDLGAAEAAAAAGRDQTLLHAWEHELAETVSFVTGEVGRLNPARVVFDSLSELRLLAQDPLRYRRQILLLKQFFAGRRCTVLLLDDLTASGGAPDMQLQSLCHGVVTLQRTPLEFGPARRRLEVAKMRGAPFREGWHDYAVRTGGLEVYPRLVAGEDAPASDAQDRGSLSSGVPTLDMLLNGGPPRGSSTLLIGPAGAGKTTVAMRYATAAAERGECAVVYQFDERRGTLLARCAEIGMDLRPHLETGWLALRQVDPAELSPGELAQAVRTEVERDGARVVVIDSLAGYLAAMPQEKQLELQMHELLSYLHNRGVSALLVHPQHGLVGALETPLGVSYVADAVLLLRFFEAGGRVRRAISAIKNRGGPHADSIRELRLGPPSDVEVGEPLSGFQGVLTGTPSYFGAADALLASGGASVGTALGGA